MASINNKVLVIIAAILMLIGWVVALGGVAKLNDVCNDYTDAYQKYYGNNGRNHRDCSDELRWQWWSIWFCFFLMVIVLVMVVLGKAAAWTSTLQIFCAVCLGVSMVAAHWTYGYDGYDAGQAALAGFIIASIALFLLIIFLGMGAAGVNVSVSVAANKTSPDGKADRVEKAPQQPKGVDNV
ncbi:hypothetical protein PLESTB_000524300 [Pleodorina starrii]|uniref:Uncharacterized protein n=1 Tax=Pleodorina starrii TaxID=330485 RepID=A0A9W6BG79_9CHLO|nr:hypothetical protein PLESTM_000387700 [Pleodorina starrii]GLC51641.1 hypothetical protein PLESTB_000524300 [Pleodorina starrii]